MLILNYVDTILGCTRKKERTKRFEAYETIGGLFELAKD
jgi:hypothetical protein